MAKTKTKKEKMVDLGPRPEKVSEFQLNKLQRIIRSMDHFTIQVGKMEISKYGLIKAMDEVQAEIDGLRDEFQKEYGTDNINIHDGTISYPPKENTPKENGETDKKD